VLSPAECAEAIADRLETGSFTAFHRLAHDVFP
jgi:hypothetical protein